MAYSVPTILVLLVTIAFRLSIIPISRWLASNWRQAKREVENQT